MLRVAITESKCGQLVQRVRPPNPKDKETFEDCSQWLGPNLPGITTPDFTERRDHGGGARRGAGAAAWASAAPPASPTPARCPGQPDISKPQVTLPPDLQRLVEQLTPRQLENLPQQLRRRIEEIVGPLPELPRRSRARRPYRRPRRARPAQRPVPAPNGAARRSSTSCSRHERAAAEQPRSSPARS